MAAMMTRASLEEQYADIEAVLLQAIDGQDVRDEMDDDDGASVRQGLCGGASVPGPPCGYCIRCDGSRRAGSPRC